MPCRLSGAVCNRTSKGSTVPVCFCTSTAATQTVFLQSSGLLWDNAQYFVQLYVYAPLAAPNFTGGAAHEAALTGARHQASLPNHAHARTAKGALRLCACAHVRGRSDEEVRPGGEAPRALQREEGWVRLMPARPLGRRREKRQRKLTKQCGQPVRIPLELFRVTRLVVHV